MINCQLRTNEVFYSRLNFYHMDNLTHEAMTMYICVNELGHHWIK